MSDHREPYESLDHKEAETSALTQSERAEDIAVLVRVMGDFLPGFAALEGYVSDGPHDVAVLGMCIRAFNSLKCAYDLLLKGYYSQSVTLARTIDEDWAACLYISRHPESAVRWFDDKPPSPSTIRKSLGFDKDIKAKLDESYSVTSSFAHSGRAAIITSIDRSADGIGLRLGGSYDPQHFTVALYMLVSAAVNLLGIPLAYLHEKHPEWLSQCTETRDAAIEWIKRINQEVLDRQERSTE